MHSSSIRPPRSLADLDGDGDVDLVGTNSGGHHLFASFQSSPGSFEPPEPFLTGSASFAAGLIDVADIDGDGDQDLVTFLHDDELGTFGVELLCPRTFMRWRT
jgi:hypothetical protein